MGRAVTVSGVVKEDECDGRTDGWRETAKRKTC